MDCECCVKYGVSPNTASFECPQCRELLCGPCTAHHKYPDREGQEWTSKSSPLSENTTQPTEP